jgi:geranylgeranyl pyrophosphate synthase
MTIATRDLSLLDAESLRPAKSDRFFGQAPLRRAGSRLLSFVRDSATPEGFVTGGPTSVTGQEIPRCPFDLETAASQPATRLLLTSPREYDALAAAYRDLLPLQSNLEPHLEGVLSDTLAHRGRLVRAQLASSLYRALATNTSERAETRDTTAQLESAESAQRLGIAIEYFHTASLIFDDMPAMDDAETRRGNPCVHRTHGEAAATLGALAFITRGYELLWTLLARLEPRVSMATSSLVADCVGLAGALNGQSLDVHFGTDRSEAAVLEIARRKTTSLLRLAVVAPALMAGVDQGLVAKLEELTANWGMAYQILDDFKDCLASNSEAGKTTGRDQLLDRPNLPLAVGLETAFERAHGAIERAGELAADVQQTVLQQRGVESADHSRSLLRIQTQLETELGRLAEALSASVS